MSDAQRRLSRRVSPGSATAVLTAAIAILGLAACTALARLPGAAAPTLPPSPTAAPDDEIRLPSAFSENATAPSAGVARPAPADVAAAPEVPVVPQAPAIPPVEPPVPAAPPRAVSPALVSGGPAAQALLDLAKDMEQDPTSQRPLVIAAYGLLVKRYPQTLEAAEAQERLDLMAASPPQKPAETATAAAPAPPKSPEAPKPAATQSAAAESPAKFALRVRCGSASDFTDKTGRQWLADRPYAPGKAWGFKGVAGDVRHHPEPVAQAEVQEIFQNARTNPQAYVFEVPKGRYTVRLGFAEPFVQAAGQRVFTVKVNGVAVLENLDLFKETGGKFRALVKEFKGVDVAGGTLTIEFARKTENPLINYIEVLQE